MSYSTIEAGFLTLLQGLTGTFATTAQCTRGDWRVLDKGLTPIAVLYPGALQSGEVTFVGGEEHIWSVNCELTARFINDGTSMTTLETVRDAVIALFQDNPNLGISDGSHISNVTGSEFVELRDTDGNGPFYLQTTLTFTVNEPWPAT